MYKFAPSNRQSILNMFKTVYPQEFKNLFKQAKKDKDLVFNKVFGYLRDESFVDLIGEQCFADEQRWLDSGRESLFVPSTSFLNALGRTKFDIVETSAIQPFEKSFVLSVPSDFEINGKKISGILVNWYESAKEASESMDSFYSKCGIETNLRPVHVNLGSGCIAMMYRVEGEEELSRCLMPTIMFESALANNTDEFIQNIQSFANDFSFQALTVEEYKIQFKLLRTVLSVMVYAQSFGDKAVKVGLPSNVAPKNIVGGIGVMKSKKMTLSVSSEFETATSGFGDRAAHFRQLMAERYYLGEHSNKKRGSRIIFVSPAIVGSHNPSTLENVE
ncbi:conserved hypothetical protein [Vibrio chagasii]|nr:hypothetical protein AOG25_13445 [Vibrio alginolyticus]CAH7187275.1 conserved hypothetical protein [Vibrio chagasii]CAH7356088.1 conserved hypothetical protein [Vibrio chagasii]